MVIYKVVTTKKDLITFGTLLTQSKCDCCKNKLLCCLSNGSGYFAVDGNLPLESILPQSLTCVYVAKFAITTPVTLWCSG